MDSCENSIKNFMHFYVAKSYFKTKLPFFLMGIDQKALWVLLRAATRLPSFSNPFICSVFSIGNLKLIKLLSVKLKCLKACQSCGRGAKAFDMYLQD